MMAALRALKAKGSSILYVTHRLGEIFEICDSVTVLRNGRHVTTRAVAGLERRELIAAYAWAPFRGDVSGAALPFVDVAGSHYLEPAHPGDCGGLLDCCATRRGDLHRWAGRRGRRDDHPVACRPDSRGNRPTSCLTALRCRSDRSASESDATSRSSPRIGAGKDFSAAASLKIWPRHIFRSAVGLACCHGAKCGALPRAYARA